MKNYKRVTDPNTSNFRHIPFFALICDFSIVTPELTEFLLGAGESVFTDRKSPNDFKHSDTLDALQR